MLKVCSRCCRYRKADQGSTIHRMAGKKPETVDQVQAAPSCVHGVDFSGAADAGKRIWIASGVVHAGRLRIERCRPARELPDSGRKRDQALTALRGFLGSQGSCAVGLDFPFSIPAELIQPGATGWVGFARSFATVYPSPEVFRSRCRAAAGGQELRRVTDCQTWTPFSPYNLRLYRQTYFGIRDLLAPLVADGSVCVLPMQRPQPGRAWLLEICPASTLKQEDLYQPYKGRSDRHHSARERIVQALEETKAVSLATIAVRSVVLENAGGDALDSVVAAFAAWRALGDLGTDLTSPYALEGRVYV